MGISYKKLKEIQNRQMTEMSRMTPENVKLFDQISGIARRTDADERTQEEWILAEGKAIVQAQRDGQSARERYGADLEQDIHARLDANAGAPVGRDSSKKAKADKPAKPAVASKDDEDVNGEPSGPVKRTPKWYVMIAWAAISFVMLIQGAAGLFIGWSGGDTEPFSHISLFSIIISAVGGIALVEMLRRLAERPDDQGKDMTSKPQVNLKGIAIYIVIVVLVLFVGYPLRDSLPIFYLAPWVSLVIGIVGLALLRPLFGQKKK
ncbi:MULTISPECIES: hypothetical protein [Paenibacillus]|uniref:hypothetical protein n=1 Tax=Paenibacillus TaxID=44249 RepID=UPI0030F6C32B